MWATADLLFILAAIVAGLAVLLLVLALRTIQTAQRGVYYSTRKRSQKLGIRLLKSSLIIGVVAAVVWFSKPFAPLTIILPISIGQFLPTVTAIPTQTAAATKIPTSTIVIPIATETSTATSTPFPATSTPSPTATEISPSSTAIIVISQPQSTFTPTPSMVVDEIKTPIPVKVLSPFNSPVVTPIPKNLKFRVIGSDTDANGAVIGIGTEFVRGIQKIIIVFDFYDMPAEAYIQHSWFREGNNVYFDRVQWTTQGSGLASMSWTPNGGFIPGLYEVRVSLNDQPQFVANFLIR
ncbi:MAG: hypothetical protein KGS46_07475 [Chloroflexi bacterium]|jgi:hypothetical protein|nr:hypothetical protein [Chloroflexota bacterium]